MLRTQRSRPVPRIPNRGSPLTRAGGPESDAAQQLYSQQARALPQSHGLHGDTVSGHTDSLAALLAKIKGVGLMSIAAMDEAQNGDGYPHYLVITESDRDAIVAALSSAVTGEACVGRDKHVYTQRFPGLWPKIGQRCECGAEEWNPAPAVSAVTQHEQP